MTSLKDQLLKAGLADKNAARKASAEKRKSNKKPKNQRGRENSSVVASQIQAQNAARDRELNRERQRQSEQKALTAQIRQLIEMNKLDRPESGIEYQFVYRKKISKILVDADMQARLASGRLAIASGLKGGFPEFEVVGTGVADKIAERNPDHVIQRIETSGDSEISQEHDPYAEFEVPDDLMW